MSYSSRQGGILCGRYSIAHNSKSCHSYTVDSSAIPKDLEYN